jgi:cell division transport system ATP-binding protein
MSACVTARERKRCRTSAFRCDAAAFISSPVRQGAGKTSLLKLIYLALRPSRGLSACLAKDMVTIARDRLPGFRRRIGVVFQDFRLVPHLSAFDNVALPLRLAGVAERDLQRPVAEMLEWVGLSHRSSARPATLSGGEQQRVAIARAVIGRPEILVADEPTGNVDPEMAARLLYLFDNLNKLGTTMVVATHDLHLLSRIGSATMMRLDGGKIAGSHGPAAPSARPSGPVLTMFELFRFSARDKGVLPEHRSSGMLPWLIAIMLFLTALACWAGMSLAGSSRPTCPPIWTGGRLIQLAEPNARLRDGQMRALMIELGKLTAVESARAGVSDEELSAMLDPWLGDTARNADIPVPALIDLVFVQNRQRRALIRSRSLVATVAPNARVTADAEWLAPAVLIVAHAQMARARAGRADGGGHGLGGGDGGALFAQHAWRNHRHHASDGRERPAGGAIVRTPDRARCAAGRNGGRDCRHSRHPAAFGTDFLTWRRLAGGNAGAMVVLPGADPAAGVRRRAGAAGGAAHRARPIWVTNCESAAVCPAC